MTAVVTLTGALSNRMTVRRLQARMVKVVPDAWHDRVPQGAFARLELLEGKLSRAVLRGLDGSNPVRLPGVEGCAAQKSALHIFPHNMLIDYRSLLDCSGDQTSPVFCILPRNVGASV
jgi:hypothetical protein